MTLLVDIRKTLSPFVIDVRFGCPDGVTALFGRSGAGKTSIVQALAGLLTPDSGRIEIGGETLYDSAGGIDVPPEDRRIGYVFQDARLFPHMNVRRNLEYGTRRNRRTATGNPSFADVVDVLDIGSLLTRQPHRLSGGERQRVAIGRALLSAPRLLLMDEPLAALDADRKWEIIPFIDRIRREFHTPIVYVSHAVDEILQIADTMVVVVDGGVAAAGPVDDIMNRPDLVRAAGDGNAGSVIPVRVERYDDAYGIAALSFDGGEFQVAAPGLKNGDRLRIRVRARDVSLATSRPRDVSVLNIFEGIVGTVSDGGQPQVDISVKVGGAVIWSQITRKSLDDLGLSAGSEVFAMVKAVAIDRPAVGPQNDRPAAGP